jgi:hypothetical protein
MAVGTASAVGTGSVEARSFEKRSFEKRSFEKRSFEVTGDRTTDRRSNGRSPRRNGRPGLVGPPPVSLRGPSSGPPTER